MFGIGVPELIVIFIVALIFIGPEKLPDLAKTLAKALTEFKKATDEVKGELDIKGELADPKKEFLKGYKETVRNVAETMGISETEDKKGTLKVKETKKEKSD